MTAAADPGEAERIKREMAECLASEVAIWEAKSRHDAKSDLQPHGGRMLLERRHTGALYNLCVDLLADDADMLTILIDIQPDDPERITLIARPRERTSGGWMDDELGIMSEMIFLRT